MFTQLFLVEIAGRRTLMLYGLGGMAVCFTLLTSMFCFKVSIISVGSFPGVELLIVVEHWATQN